MHFFVSLGSRPRRISPPRTRPRVSWPKLCWKRSVNFEARRRTTPKRIRSSAQVPPQLKPRGRAFSSRPIQRRGRPQRPCGPKPGTHSLRPTVSSGNRRRASPAAPAMHATRCSRARDIATRLGAAPLLSDIESLARRARISLGAPLQKARSVHFTHATRARCSPSCCGR